MREVTRLATTIDTWQNEILDPIGRGGTRWVNRGKSGPQRLRDHLRWPAAADHQPMTCRPLLHRYPESHLDHSTEALWIAIQQVKSTCGQSTADRLRLGSAMNGTAMGLSTNAEPASA